MRRIQLVIASLALLGATPAAAQGPSFRVEIDGVPTTSFASVDGLGIEQEIREFRAGTEPTIRRVPGASKYTDIILKRGFVPKSPLFGWMKTSRTSARGMAVLLTDASGRTVQRWTLARCLPRSWTVTLGGTFPVEQLVVSCERLEDDTSSRIAPLPKRSRVPVLRR